jgi:hypothetical protein
LLTVYLKKQSNTIPVVLRARARIFERVTSCFAAVASKPSFRRFHNTKEKHMSKPTHIAYVVSEPKDGETKGYWREIGAAWPHEDGEGFDVVIYDQLSVAGRITCRERKEKPAKAE